MMHTRHEVLRCLLICFLRMLERLVTWFNTYAWSYVAIYGYPYMESAKKAWNLLMDKGFKPLVNDSLVFGVTSCAVLVGGMLGAVSGYFLSLSFALTITHTDGSPYFFAVYGWVVGAIISSLMLESVEAGVTCLFVCMAEEPEQLQVIRPALYGFIATEYPGIFQGKYQPPDDVASTTTVEKAENDIV